ncbi:phosphomannomutase, partial [Halobacteriales archaeon QH_7_69_31]
NPPTDNGLKLFVDGTEYDVAAERTLTDRVEDVTGPVEWAAWGSTTRASVLEPYRRDVADYARDRVGDCDGLSVAVDCGNGMAGAATPQVLRMLGAQVVALDANVDGHFPARRSKPTPESLSALRTFVAEGTFALGIGHDGDADRIAVVDADGDVVHEDTVLAVLGALHEGVDAALSAGGDDTEVVFAGEPWKHVHTALGPWIDGVASAAVLAGLVADEGLADLRAPIEEKPYRKASVPCPDDRKGPVMSHLESRLPEAFPEATVDTEYGVRLALDDGAWTLVRPSGTEPYVRVYAESETVDDLMAAVRDVVEAAVETSGGE